MKKQKVIVESSVTGGGDIIHKIAVWGIIIVAGLCFLAALMSAGGCTITPHPDYKPEQTIGDIIKAKQNVTLRGCEPLSSIGNFGSYFTNHYNGSQYTIERFVQFKYINPATTKFLWQQNAKARSYMLAKYNYIIP